MICGGLEGVRFDRKFVFDPDIVFFKVRKDLEDILSDHVVAFPIRSLFRRFVPIRDVEIFIQSEKSAGDAFKYFL
jgi:hypothetical protein